MSCVSNRGYTIATFVQKNATIDPFFSYIGTTYSRVVKNAAIVFFFFFFPTITTSCYIQVPSITTPYYHNFLLHLNITSSINKSRTTSSQHKIAKRYIYTSVVHHKKYIGMIFFTFNTTLKQPQAIKRLYMIGVRLRT